MTPAIASPAGARLWPLVLVIALLLPLGFGSNRSDAPLGLGLPRVHSGDEVHYLVALNSVIVDGDLDLANNYAGVHAGSGQAGRRRPARRRVAASAPRVAGRAGCGAIMGSHGNVAARARARS